MIVRCLRTMQSPMRVEHQFVRSVSNNRTCPLLPVGYYDKYW